MQPLVERVFHPTDLSPNSEVAFAHALAIALVRQARLTVLNASPDFATKGWKDFPRVRDTLERWGLLEPGSDRSAVFRELQVKVEKIGVDNRNPVDAIQRFLDENPTDLMVVGTEARSGLPRFLRDSVAQEAARASGAPTLYVPGGKPGFVDPASGRLSLKRILVPVAKTPTPDDSAEIATRAAESFGDPPVEIHLLHVGDAMPDVKLIEGEGWSWHFHTRQGDPVDEILAEAAKIDANLIVMTSDGRDSWIDAFRGSHTERVVRGAPCPVAALPIPKAR